MITNAAITSLNTLAALSAVLFGNSATFYKAKSAAVDYAASVAGAGKEAKKANGQLAAFDELNVLNKQEDAGSGGGAGTPAASEMFEKVEVPGWIQEIGDKIKGFLQSVWEAAEPTRAALARLWEQLKVIGGFAWGALKDFYNQFLVPVGKWMLGEGLPRFIDAVTNGLAKVDWQKINNALAKLWDALTPFAITVGEGLLWFWENVLVPLGTWVLNDALPAFLEAVASVVAGLDVALQKLGDAFLYLWDNALVYIAEFIGDAILAFFGWIADNGELVAGIIIALVAAIVAYNAVMAIYNVITGIASAVTTALSWPVLLVALAIAALIAIIVLCILYWDEICAAAGACWEGIVGFFSGLGQWFYDTVISPIVNFFTGLWDGVNNLASSAWEGIKGVWNAVATWFNDTIVSPIANFFGGLWNGIKTGASTLAGFIQDYVIDPIVNAFKWLYNGVVGIIEGIINGFIWGINAVIGVINLIPGVNLPLLNEMGTVNIPRLAQGAVIPPTGSSWPSWATSPAAPTSRPRSTPSSRPCSRRWPRAATDAISPSGSQAPWPSSSASSSRISTRKTAWRAEAW